VRRLDIEYCRKELAEACQMKADNIYCDGEFIAVCDNLVKLMVEIQNGQHQDKVVEDKEA
jgi:hypothetical protein